MIVVSNGSASDLLIILQLLAIFIPILSKFSNSAWIKIVTVLDIPQCSPVLEGKLMAINVIH
jgi:hypothetical protein